MHPAMADTAAGSVPSQDGGQHQELRERATLVAFVVVAIIATTSWLVLLGWLAIVALRALGL